MSYIERTVGFEFAAKTDTGKVRPQNEDAVALSPEHGFVVLADGMGGYNAGEVASNIATTITSQILEDGLRSLQGEQVVSLGYKTDLIQQLMVDAIQSANDAILSAAGTEPQYTGMGTTLIAATLHNDQIVIAHVGDSRAYRFRQGELVQITRDHSLLQEQIDAGLVNPEWAHYAQNRNLVTRAVGVAPEMEVEVHDHYMEQGDVYLLCSDGLSDMLLAAEMSDILAQCQSSLEETSRMLVQTANDNGGHDNISVILIRVRSASSKTAGLFGRFLNRAA